MPEVPPMSAPLRLGLAGLGTVGIGVVKIVQTQADLIAVRTGRPVAITAVSARDPKKNRDADLSAYAWETNPVALARRDDIDVFVEVMGGQDGPALAATEAAIAAGKDVVTANKALLAHHGQTLAEAAEAKGAVVRFEAAVAGGIPVVKALTEGLAANRIKRVMGVMNGTCNYILTRMQLAGLPYETVFEEARQLGYLEADPNLDVGGIDAGHKLSLLSAIAFGTRVSFDAVELEGIGSVSIDDIRLAEDMGYRIKLLGVTRRRVVDGRAIGVELRVHPTLIPDDRLIANVNGVMNAILVQGDAVGPTLYYGPGAGSEPTASSVVADIVDVARTLTADPEHRVPHLAFQADRLSSEPVLPIESVRTSYYLRVTVLDQPGVLWRIAQILSDAGISIEALIQKEAPEDQDTATMILLTSVTEERSMNEAIRAIEAQDATRGPVRRIRMEKLDG